MREIERISREIRVFSWKKTAIIVVTRFSLRGKSDRVFEIPRLIINCLELTYQSSSIDSGMPGGRSLDPGASKTRGRTVSTLISRMEKFTVIANGSINISIHLDLER